MVRIACSPEEHYSAIRAEAERVGRQEGCEVEVGMQTPRLAAVTFTSGARVSSSARTRRAARA